MIPRAGSVAIRDHTDELMFVGQHMLPECRMQNAECRM